MKTQFWKLVDKVSGDTVGVVEVDQSNEDDLAMATETHGYKTWDEVQEHLGFGEGDLVAYHPGLPDPEPFFQIKSRYNLERVL